MEIEGKTVLVLGATGMVGQAITRKIITKKPKTLVLSSLYEHEVAGFTENLEQEFGNRLPPIKWTWGNSFVRHEWKDLNRQELLADPKIRHQLIFDLIDPLNKETLTQMEIYRLLNRFRPEIVIDTVNLIATMPYANIFDAARETFNALKRCATEKTWDDLAAGSIEKLLLAQYIPNLTKHVQIFFQAMVHAETKLYLKTGNIGTGAGTMNIPFSHTHDNPPQYLLAKSALAGAHTLLLFLMAKTPNAPIVKEIKPKAAIAWKRIGFGPVIHRGRALLLEDATLSDAVSLTGKLSKGLLKKPKTIKHNGEPKALTAPFIDLGESSLFALGEFEVLTEEGQLEFTTPEDIATEVVSEIEGRNTGHDVVAALEKSSLGPSYRAGMVRDQAIQKLHEAVKNSGVESIAFELLGPPRLSKLLYEAHLLKKVCASFENVLGTEPQTVSKALEKHLLENQGLRSQILSIGLPILLSKGDKILRGSRIAIPADIPGKPDAQFDITPENIERWTFDGWIDLRESNVQKWQERLQSILETIGHHRTTASSSFSLKAAAYWNHAEGVTPIDAAKVTNWVLKSGGL